MNTGSGRGWWRLAALALALAQLPVLVRTAADPSQSDFANYFTPAFVLSRGGDLGALYDRDTFSRAMVASGMSGLGSFIPHPPANALWLLPLATAPPGTAKGLWSVALLLALTVTILSAARLGAGFHPWLAAVLVLAPTLAIRNGLAFGQPYFILAALLVAGALALEKGRPFSAGLLLGLGVSFKPYALGVGLLFVSKTQRRALAGFICGALAPSLLVLTMTGAGPFVEFASKVLPRMLQGEIQDPFSPGWGSGMALFNRLFRFEPDLNPHPWFDAPLIARFMGAVASATLLVLGVFGGRRALEEGRPLDAIGVTVACTVAASPFAASYHLVLLTVSVLALAGRWRGRATVAMLFCWALLGSGALTALRSADGALTPLAYARFFALATLALAVSSPFVNRRGLGLALGAGVLAGVTALPWGRSVEVWPRVEAAHGYSMSRPYFCGAGLRWMSPSADGRRLESRGAGADCSASGALAGTGSGDALVVSRFRDGSWNLYLVGPDGDARLTFSDANEIDPVLTPDRCAVVFASDQGRGLGSTALYRRDLSSLIEGCEAPGLGAAER